MFNRSALRLIIISSLLLSGCLIKGKIVDKNGAGIAGITVNLSGTSVSMTTTTDSNGVFQFGSMNNMLSAGSYTVVPSASEYVFKPVSRSVTITNQTLGESDSVPFPVSGVDFETYSFINSAQLKVRGYSFAMDPASTSNEELIGFTTYDGVSGVPLNENGDISSEIMPAILGESSYLADYVISDVLGAYEWGQANLTLPILDANNNGFPDFLEVGKDVNVSFTGSTNPDWNYYDDYSNITLSGTLSRSANSSTGSYTGTANRSTQTFTFSGSWKTLYLPIYLIYSITDGNAIIKESLDSENIMAAVTYTCNGTDEILLEGFEFETEGVYITFESSVLNRNGTFFRGNVQAQDGGPYTSFRDYVNWHFEIEDNNDWDGDGVPDLADPLIPISD